MFLSCVACRTVFALVASVMLCLGSLATAFTSLRLLLACAMFGGFVFGWHWSLMPVQLSIPPALLLLLTCSVLLRLTNSAHAGSSHCDGGVGTEAGCGFCSSPGL